MRGTPRVRTGRRVCGPAAVLLAAALVLSGCGASGGAGRGLAGREGDHRADRLHTGLLAPGAARPAGGTFVTMLGRLAMAIGAAAPFLAVVAVLAALWRLLHRRRGAKGE